MKKRLSALLSPSSRLKRAVSLVAAANWAGSELTALVSVGGNRGADPGLKAVFTAPERRCTVNAIAVSKTGFKGGVCRITATANISQTAHVWGLNTAVRMFFSNNSGGLKEDRHCLLSLCFCKSRSCADWYVIDLLSLMDGAQLGYFWCFTVKFLKLAGGRWAVNGFNLTLFVWAIFQSYLRQTTT